MIDKNLHFIWYSSCNKQPPQHFYFSIEAFKRMNPDYTINTKVIIEDIDESDLDKEVVNSIKPDDSTVIRLRYDHKIQNIIARETISKNGGISLHADCYPIKPFGTINYDRIQSYRIFDEYDFQLLPGQALIGQASNISKANKELLLYVYRSYFNSRHRMDCQRNADDYIFYENLRTKFFNCTLSEKDFDKNLNIFGGSYILHFEEGLIYKYGFYQQYLKKNNLNQCN